MQLLNPDDIRWSVLIASLVMLTMAVFVIAFVIYYQTRRLEQEKKLRDIEKKYQRRLLETALNSEEAERRRIAQDLHDDIGTMLSLTKLSINQLLRSVKDKQGQNPADGPLAQEATRAEFTLNKAQSLVEETIIQVRRITRDLVPTTLEQFGLIAAIDEFMLRLGDTPGLVVHFHYNTDELPRQKPQVELALYRIMQELVNNAIKHADCDEIEIDLHLDQHNLELQVTDNGRGFDAARVQAGLGLRNIESRLSVINGVVYYQKPGIRGARARVQIPIEAVQPARAEPLHPFQKSGTNKPQNQ